MRLPLNDIRIRIRSGQITRVRDIFEIGSFEDWEQVITLRRDTFKRIKDGQFNFRWIHAAKIAETLRMDVEEIANLINNERVR